MREGRYRDITDRTHSEAARRESESRLHALMTATSDVVYRMSPDWKTMRELYGRCFLANTVEPACSWLDMYIHPDDQQFVSSVIDACINEKIVFELEHRVMRADGSIGWTFSRAIPIFDGNGEIIEWFGTASDITERKQAEDALRESEQKARALVKELENADRNKNRFISVLSHELRNPLAVIVASLSLLEIADNPEQISISKEIIKRQSNQLCKLVDDLLDISRINENKIKLKNERIDLREVLENASLDAGPEYREKGVLLKTDIPETPISLNADPARIAQCVGNLLHNALKFTPPSGDVTLSLTRDGSEAVIRVCDSGIGIAPELLACLFEPFTQAETSPDRQSGGGLGLGLSIVKGIVSLHGGTVTADSNGPGKGSLFTIRLPITAEGTASRDTEGSKKADKAFSILVIDDNRNLASILCSTLGLMGHEASTAHTGEEGLSAAKRLRPNIIICDIGLPGMSGYEVARLVKSDEALKKTFLIALTGYAGDYDIDQARERGFDRHLAKPVDLPDLEKALADLLI